MDSWSRIARRIRVPLGFGFAALYLWLAEPAWYSVVCGGAVALAGLGLRAAASGHVRTDDAVRVAEALGEIVEVAAVAREAVDAHQHARIARVAPLRIPHAMEPVRVQAQHACLTHRAHRVVKATNHR